MVALFITHPEVVVDPHVPVTRWRLSDKGVARMRTFVASPVVERVGAVWASSETKAIEAAGLLAARLGLPVNVNPELGENDRTATGYLPPDEFEVVADAFFERPFGECSGLGAGGGGPSPHQPGDGNHFAKAGWVRRHRRNCPRRSGYSADVRHARSTDLPRSGSTLPGSFLGLRSRRGARPASMARDCRALGSASTPNRTYERRLISAGPTCSRAGQSARGKG